MYVIADGLVDFSCFADLYRKRWDALSSTRSATESLSQHLKLCKSTPYEIVSFVFTCYSFGFCRMSSQKLPYTAIENGLWFQLWRVISSLYDPLSRGHWVVSNNLVVYCRLATVQSGRLPTAPLVSTKRDVSDDDRCALLSNIRQLVPDHATRFRVVQVDFLCVLRHGVRAVFLWMKAVYIHLHCRDFCIIQLLNVLGP